MKEKTLYIDTPPININKLSEKDDFQVDFDLKREDFLGVLRIRLDPDAIEWETQDGEDYFPRSCNSLVVSVTTELDISEVQFLNHTYILVIEYLVIFFNCLQTELRQFWVDIGPIRDWGLLTFLDKTIVRRIVVNGDEKIKIPFGLDKNIRFSPKRRKYPEKYDSLDVKQISEIKSWFDHPKEPELAKILLANAKRLLLHSDYKLSSVLAMTALEGPLEAFVDERCKIKGISGKLNTLGYNLSILSSILDGDELTEWLAKWLEAFMHWHVGTFEANQIIDWANELRRARNKAVHEGEIPDFDTLDKGIFAVEALYEFTKKV